MVSPFVLDNLNLGGHGGIAGLGSEETNQYSAAEGVIHHRGHRRSQRAFQA